MKHKEYFDQFLENKVNLNKSKVENLNTKVKSIIDWLKNTLDGYQKYEYQGSYAMKTIIKPPKDKDFDADIMIYVKDRNIGAADYLHEIYNLFLNNGNYKDIVTLESRCVRIKYAGYFHLDIVPCIERNNNKYICNKDSNEYEETDGTEYRRWLTQKNKQTHRCLKRVTKLLKYMRDVKTNFSCKSILLTTLLGYQINSSGNYNDIDIPTLLKEICNKLNDFLQQNSTMPIIRNPVLETEDFNRHWDEDKYSNFRNKIQLYTEKINAAFDEKDHNKSVKKWRDIFGDEFGELQEGNGYNSNRLTVPAVKPHAFNHATQLSENNYAFSKLYSPCGCIEAEVNKEMLEINKIFPNLYFEKRYIKGVIDVCAVYIGSKRILLSPNQNDIKKYGNTYVEDIYEIKIDLSNGNTYETGKKIERTPDNHINSNGSCCLGIHERNPESLMKYIQERVVPYFFWHAYKSKYKQAPSYGEWSHGELGIQEYEQEKKALGRNDTCLCGSGKKYKNCCLLKQ